MCIMILKSVFITLLLLISTSINSYCSNCEDNNTCSLPKINKNNNDNNAENMMENNNNKDENDNKIKDNND